MGNHLVSQKWELDGSSIIYILNDIDMKYITTQITQPNGFLKLS